MANTMAPIFPMISSLGWIAMPVIIILEGLFYYRASINNPLKLSIYSNLTSALFGLIVAVVTLPILLGPAVDPHLPSIYAGAIISMVGVAFHWWLSSFLEYKFSRWHKLWRDTNAPISLFYRANGITYSLILVLFIVMIIRQLIEYYDKI